MVRVDVVVPASWHLAPPPLVLRIGRSMEVRHCRLWGLGWLDGWGGAPEPPGAESVMAGPLCSSWEEGDPWVHCQAFTLDGANALTSLKEGRCLWGLHEGKLDSKSDGVHWFERTVTDDFCMHLLLSCSALNICGDHQENVRLSGVCLGLLTLPSLGLLCALHVGPRCPLAPWFQVRVDPESRRGMPAFPGCWRVPFPQQTGQFQYGYSTCFIVIGVSGREEYS